MYCELDAETIAEIENLIDELIEEIKPKKNVYEFDTLYELMELKLESYSIEVNGKIDPAVVDYVKDELEENLTPSALNATNGIDNLLSWIFSIEIASIIVKNERDKIEALSDEGYSVNVGKIGLMKAINYLFGFSDRYRWDDISDELKKICSSISENTKKCGMYGDINRNYNFDFILFMNL